MTLSRFGNSGLMLPAAGIVVGWLYLRQSHRDAMRCFAWLALAVSLVAMSKIAFFGWGVGLRSLNFTGISGHAMLASAVLPIVAYDFLPLRNPMWRWAGWFVGLLTGIAVGVSRVMMEAHSPAESIAGCVLGALIALVVIRSSSQNTPSLSPKWVVVPILALILLFTYGKPWDMEDSLITVSLAISGHDQPFSRETWLVAGR
jgi:membrane-associated phospholipid phosphatase